MPRDAAAHASRLPGATLYRYVFREVAFPTLFTLLGLTLLVLTRELLGLSDLVINRGLGATTVAALALYQAVPLFSNMLPFAVLVGTLVGLGRLAADQEVLVLEACGVAAPRLARPIVATGALLTALALALSAWAAPAASRALDATLARIALEHPGATIRSGFVHRFGGWRLDAREVSSGGDRMRGVLIEVPELGETVFAASGSLQQDARGATRLHLGEGTVVSAERDKAWLIHFESATSVLPGSGTEIERRDRDRVDAAPLFQLLIDGWQDERDSKEARWARKELHRRFAAPTSTLCFALLVVPLFLARGANSRAGGGLLGVIAVLTYYGLVQLGDGLAQGRTLPIGAGVWLPNIVMLLAATGLSRWSRNRPVQTLRGDGESLSTRLNAWLERRADRKSGTPAKDGAARKGRPRRVRTHRWALQRYVAGSYLKLVLLSFSVLLAGYLVVDVLERLQWFAKYNATASEAVRFYGLRVPLLASRVVPMSLLVATAMLVSLMAVRGELIGMRSSGIPAPRGMLPVLLLAAAVVPLSFVLSDVIVPRANAMNEVLKSTEIKVDEVWRAPREKNGKRQRKAVWYRDGNRLLEAERLDPQAGTVLGLTVYELDAKGLPQVRHDAHSGRHVGDGTWRLMGPVRIDVGDEGLQRGRGSRSAELWEDVPAEIDTRSLSVADVREEIRRVSEHGYDTTMLRVDLHAKLAAPFACLVLPAVVFLFALAGPPYPSTASALVVCLAVAVGSTLLTGVAVSLGYGGAIPPGLAGWAPTLLFAGIATRLGVRVLRGA